MIHHNVVTVSPKYQIVIPQEVRHAMQIEPGEKIQMFVYNNRIELVPIKDIKKMKGFLKGMDTNIERDEDRL